MSEGPTSVNALTPERLEPESVDENIVYANRKDYAVIHDLWREVAGKIATDELFMKRLRMAMETIKKPFRKGEKCSDFSYIDFNDPANCCAYLIRYAICYSSLAKFATEEFFTNVPEEVVGPLKTQTSISVVSLGGGPGNDALGFCSALPKCTSVREVKMCVMDCWNGWQMVLQEMVQVIDRRRREGVVTPEDIFGELDVNFDFKQADLTSRRSDIRMQLGMVKMADVILIVKFLSILKDEDKKCTLKTVFSSMKAGALLLYVDTQADFLCNLATKDNTLRIVAGPGQRRFYQLNCACGICVNGSSFQVCAVYKLGS